MIRTWILDIRPLYEADRYQACYKELPIFRKEKADKLRFQEGKAQSAGVWMLLEKIRKKYRISEKAAFNLSHSGDYVLCSVDMNCREHIQVGCDIQIVEQIDIKLAERFFCRREYERILEGKNKEQQNDLFYRFWVLKESFMKATRKGMAMDIGSFEIQLSSPPVLIKKPGGYPREYFYQEYEWTDAPYKIAVCSTEKDIDSKIQMEMKA